jgi:LPS-assembly lipoprotein
MQNVYAFKPLSIAGVLLLLILVSGCGFHLRGDVQLPPLYDRVHLVDKGYSDIGRPLASALKTSGTEIVSSSGAATSVVTLLSRGVQRKALNVGSREVREYELQLDVSFVVQDNTGKQIAQPQTVSVIRNYRNDPDDVLAKSNEESIIRQEMNQTVVNQILRRLKAIGR